MSTSKERRAISPTRQEDYPEWYQQVVKASDMAENSPVRGCRETLRMHEIYREFIEEKMAIPVILGEKSPRERFPGAVNMYTLEAMTQDRKALQMGTSHYLGQNFAKGSGIKFSNKEGSLEYAYTTSWGVTTRMIGAMITHLTQKKRINKQIF